MILVDTNVIIDFWNIALQLKPKKYFLKKINNSENPRIKGEALSHNLKGYWKYKPLKNYRIIVEIQDDELIVLAVEIEHRSKVYLILNKLKKSFLK